MLSKLTKLLFCFILSLKLIQLFFALEILLFWFSDKLFSIQFIFEYNSILPLLSLTKSSKLILCDSGLIIDDTIKT